MFSSTTHTTVNAVNYVLSGQDSGFENFSSESKSSDSPNNEETP